LTEIALVTVPMANGLFRSWKVTGLVARSSTTPDKQ